MLLCTALSYRHDSESSHHKSSSNFSITSDGGESLGTVAVRGVKLHTFPDITPEKKKQQLSGSHCWVNSAAPEQTSLIFLSCSLRPAADRVWGCLVPLRCRIKMVGNRKSVGVWQLCKQNSISKKTTCCCRSGDTWDEKMTAEQFNIIISVKHK